MVTAILLYCIALSVTVYDKYCVMLDRWEKPGLYHKPVPFILFSTAKLLLILAYCVLFYLAGGISLALGALLLHFILGSVFLRIFFRKRVAIWYTTFVETIRCEQREGDKPMNESEIQRQALALAESAASKAMKNES